MRTKSLKASTKQLATDMCRDLMAMPKRSNLLNMMKRLLKNPNKMKVKSQYLSQWLMMSIDSGNIIRNALKRKRNWQPSSSQRIPKNNQRKLRNKKRSLNSFPILSIRNGRHKKKQRSQKSQRRVVCSHASRNQSNQRYSRLKLCLRQRILKRLFLIKTILSSSILKVLKKLKMWKKRKLMNNLRKNMKSGSSTNPSRKRPGEVLIQ